MHVISFVSSKGGVGKSTLAANIASALRRRGKRVLAIDLDPQNGLGLHFGMAPDDPAGVIREGLQRHALFSSPSGVHFAPFGKAGAADIREFTAFLKAHPRWLAASLSALAGLRFDFVCIDTPPGPSPQLEQALVASHRVLAVMLADAASYAAVPQIESLVDHYTAGRPDFEGMHLLLNQMPIEGRLGHQVRQALGEESEGRMVPVSIHRDPRVPMAMAHQEPVVLHAPGAMVSMDIEYVTDWLLGQCAG